MSIHKVEKIGDIVSGLFAAALALLLVVLAVGAFTSGGTGVVAASKSAERGPITVVISGLSFTKGVRTIVAGTSVTWTNADSAPHTVTASDGTFDSGTDPPLAKGKTFTHRFGDMGRYDYVCRIHPFMKGSIVVVPTYG